MDEIKRELDIIKQILTRDFNPLAIILFGSYARNSQTSESDIDIAIIKKDITKKELFYEKQKLELEISKDVDLVNLEDLDMSDGFKYEILMNGILIHVENSYEYEIKKMDMIREFLDFNEKRQDIIERVKKERIYMENKAVILNKYETIEKCINRINEEYEGNVENLQDYRKMDMIVLNLQRACEAVLDLAMYIVSNRKLGLPQNKRDAFKLLEENKIIDNILSKKMQGMVGFRNIAVHDYKEIDEEILKDIIENGLEDLKTFARVALNL